MTYPQKHAKCGNGYSQELKQPVTAEVDTDLQSTSITSRKRKPVKTHGDFNSSPKLTQQNTEREEESEIKTKIFEKDD